MWLIKQANMAVGGAPARRIKSLGFALVLGSAAIATDATAQTGEPVYTVMNPTGIAPAIQRRAMAPRPESLDGKTIYLVDVTFNGGDLFLQEMEKWMAVNMPEVDAIYRIKKGAYNADDPELWREIKAADGLMVMAIGH